MFEKQTEEKSSYRKRPLWQWVALSVAIGVVVYGVIYYVFLHKQNPYTNQVRTNQQTQQNINTVYKMTPKGNLGTVMTDLKGMTLYTYSKDTAGMSNCTNQCLSIWPAYVAKAKTGNFPTNISVIKRPDGTWQYAWKTMPLYYYAKDGDSGDAYGNGIGGVWSVIK